MVLNWTDGAIRADREVSGAVGTNSLREPWHPGPLGRGRRLGVEEGGKVTNEKGLLTVGSPACVSGQSGAAPVLLGQPHGVRSGLQPPLLLGDGPDLRACRNLGPTVAVVQLGGKNDPEIAESGVADHALRPELDGRNIWENNNRENTYDH